MARLVDRIGGMMSSYSMPSRITAESPISLKTILLKGLGGGRGMGEFGKCCRGSSGIGSGGPAGRALYNAGSEKGGSVETRVGVGAALSARAAGSGGVGIESGRGL